MSKLNHFDSQGKAHMVDVGNKASSHRTAIAGGRILMQAETMVLIQQGEMGKGDVLGIARVAGIMAAKKTHELVPLCHPLMISNVEIEMQINNQQNAIECHATVKTSGQTGVEMEALTAVQITLLTIYDMCKAVDRGMTMENIGLLHKSGGKSGDWNKT